MKVRTRFAPSPTGYLHVGGVRTALFCWLLARQHGGQFVLRLEDTDKKREVRGADKHLEDSLKSLGLIYDEGPDIGGPYAPYRQSERLESYKAWALKLVEAGRAYADPYSSAELESLRQQAKAAKKPFLFRDQRPKNPPQWDGSQPLRFKSEPKAYNWHDEVMGDLSTGPEVIDDFILIKSDGYPTYNFSHIVDDAEMEITHIIRGQEFTASMPNYLNLYEALRIERPVLATVPHILGPTGTKKLSKRDGAKDVLDYVRDGFLPDALINFIASLGWNDGTEQEIYSRRELIEKFSLSQVQRSGARFDEKRLVWMNGQHIAKLSDKELMQRIANEGFWPAEASKAGYGHKQKIVSLIKQRIHTLADVPRMSSMFFNEPKDDVVAALMEATRIDAGTRRQMLEAANKELSESTFTEDDIRDRLNGLLTKLNTKPAILFSLIRIAVSGEPYSPELFGSLAILGKEKTLQRLDKALSRL